MLQRITYGAAARQMNGDLQSAMRQLTTIQHQLTTGRRINRMSDGPADAVNSLAHRAELRRNEQFERNIDKSQTWLRTADLALTNASDGLASARGLLVQARSAALDGPARKAIADQIRQIRESMLGNANMQVSGRPLFGGTTAGATAYDTSATYQGDAGDVVLAVSPSLSMTVNVTGPTAFGMTNLSDPLNGDVFQLLGALATAVENNDQTVLPNATTLVDAAVVRLDQTQVVLGSRSAQLEALTEQNIDASISLKGAISKLEDIDLPEAMIGLKTKEAAYQAALQVAAKVMQPSLMDFLR